MSSLQWQDFLLRYGKSSEKLPDKIASLARWLANNIIDWKNINALMASRLIALDKAPGFGEVLRHILGKLMVLVTGPDVEEVCGIDQLSSGITAGIEGAFIVCVIFLI